MFEAIWITTCSEWMSWTIYIYIYIDLSIYETLTSMSEISVVRFPYIAHSTNWPLKILVTSVTVDGPRTVPFDCWIWTSIWRPQPCTAAQRSPAGGCALGAVGLFNAPGCFFSGFVRTNMAKVEEPEKELANLAGFFLVFLECLRELKWQEWANWSTNSELSKQQTQLGSCSKNGHLKHHPDCNPKSWGTLRHSVNLVSWIYLSHTFWVVSGQNRPCPWFLMARSVALPVVNVIQ